MPTIKQVYLFQKRKRSADVSVILLSEYHAVKSVFDGRNPLSVEEIAFAVKSCFAGL